MRRLYLRWFESNLTHQINCSVHSGQRLLASLLFMDGKQHPAKCRDDFRNAFGYCLLRAAAEGFPIGIQEHGHISVQFRACLCGLQLPLLHALPADKAIKVIDEEDDEADNDGQIAGILHSGQCPQDDQHHIVDGIGQGKVGTAA